LKEREIDVVASDQSIPTQHILNSGFFLGPWYRGLFRFYWFSAARWIQWWNSHCGRYFASIRCTGNQKIFYRV